MKDYLSMIHQSSVHLQLAHEFAQKGERGKSEAVKLIEAAESKLKVARQALLKEM